MKLLLLLLVVVALVAAVRQEDPTKRDEQKIDKRHIVISELSQSSSFAVKRHL